MPENSLINKTHYKRLGDYIREVDSRNRDLAVTLSQGICNAKYFQNPKQVADRPETHKVVRTRQFAYNRATTRNGEKISIALRDGPDCTVSSAYQVFEVIDEEKLLPEYLMMWFRRPEFDRLAIYHSHGSAHEFFEWEAMCDVRLPIPPISRQREIVAEYETLTSRIRLNERLISSLESAAQTLYRRTFVDNIDPTRLPPGWRTGTLGEFCVKMTSGGTPSRSRGEYWNSPDYPWVKTGEVQNNVILETEEYISRTGLENSSAKLVPAGTVVMAMYGATAAQVGYLNFAATTNQACCNMICSTKEESAFLFFHLRFHQDEIKRMAIGGAQENLSQDLIAKLPIPLIEDRSVFTPFLTILNQLILVYREIKTLKELQALDLMKLGE